MLRGNLPTTCFNICNFLRRELCRRMTQKKEAVQDMHGQRLQKQIEIKNADRSNREAPGSNEATPVERASTFKSLIGSRQVLISHTLAMMMWLRSHCTEFG